MNRTTPPDVANLSAALLDEAFRDLLVEQPDLCAHARFRRKRIGGAVILLLACLCVAAIAALPLGAVPLAAGPGGLDLDRWTIRDGRHDPKAVRTVCWRMK